MTAHWRKTAHFTVAGLFVFLLAMPKPEAQETAQCEVHITTPKEGDKVGRDGKVRGTAKIPPINAYLWVLAHMKDLVAEWWPQGERPAIIQDSQWVIIAAYGREKDVGEQFEVAAVVVDANTNARLLEWSKTAREKDYPPIEFPSVIDGCVPVKITVVKTSH